MIDPKRDFLAKKVYTRESEGLGPYNPLKEAPPFRLGEDNKEFIAYMKKKYHK